MATKQKPRVGDTCWFVRWCIKRGMVDEEHPEYGGDPDKDVDRSARCETREEAERKAREVYPLDQYGCVAYWPAEFVAYDEDDAVRYPHVGFWDATADPEVFDGE